MKLAIIGLPGAGKTTVFEALAGDFAGGGKGETRLGAIRVPDARIDTLSGIFKPRKTIYAQVEYFLPGKTSHKKEPGKEDTSWAAVRDADAFIHVVRNFSLFGLSQPQPWKDFKALDEELILVDLAVTEKRLERMAADAHKSKKPDPEERSLVEECHALLEKEIPIRTRPELAASPKLRGYALLSAKPMLMLFNNSDEDDALPRVENADTRGVAEENRVVIRGKLEQELARMTESEAAEMLSEFGIPASATHRVVKASYGLLGLVSFFTVGEDEVRAWTIKQGTTALDAAEVIHSDIKKGFIRAEVIGCGDFLAAGSMAAAKKHGKFRLEGKTYEVRDGDIINFRFNV